MRCLNGSVAPVFVVFVVATFFSHVQNIYVSWMQLGRCGIRDAKLRTTQLPSSSKLIPLELPFCLFLFYISISKLLKPIPFHELDKEIFMKNADIILTLTEKVIWLWFKCHALWESRQGGEAGKDLCFLFHRQHYLPCPRKEMRANKVQQLPFIFGAPSEDDAFLFTVVASALFCLCWRYWAFCFQICSYHGKKRKTHNIR